LKGGKYGASDRAPPAAYPAVPSLSAPIDGCREDIYNAIRFSGFVLWCVEEPTTFASVNYTNELLSSIFILAFFTRVYAYAALMFGQKYTDSMSVAIIASTDPVITLLLAVLIPVAFGTGEKFNAVSFSGAIVIAMGSVIAGSNFMTRKKLRREET
jgi:drug/metabolite transporter (DMT)-like permease